MTPRRVPAVEGEPVSGLTSQEVSELRSALTSLSETLKPTLPFQHPSGDSVIIRNLVGSVEVNPGLVLDISPKVPAHTDWAAAVVELLTTKTRARFGGLHQTGVRRHARMLPDAFADLYCNQLDQAIRREGPLTLLRAHELSSSSLTGRLDVSRWVASQVLRPSEFPQHRSHLTVDNDYSNALAWVALTLAARTSDRDVASRLLRAAARLRPGMSGHARLAPGIALRAIPSQWREYRPAWETARSVIQKIAPLHSDGSRHGVGLAIEPWPLLETLLRVTLEQVPALAEADGLVGVDGHGHLGNYLLRSPLGAVAVPGDDSLQRLSRPGWVNPDGVLRRDGRVLATFEAKYSKPSLGSLRQHSHQALTTAAAVGARNAVIVYPEAGPTVSWSVTGFGQFPDRLHAVGLDLFTYRHDDHRRSKAVYELLRGVLSESSTRAPVAARA